MDKLLMVIGDSLPYPKEDVGVRVTDTWACKLSARFNAIWFQPVGGSTISEMRKRLEKTLAYVPKSTEAIIVVSQGIVDITPRPYPRWMHKPLRIIEVALGEALGFSFRMEKIRSLYFIYGRCWTPLGKFGREVDLLLEACKRFDNLRILWLETFEPGEKLTKTVGVFKASPLNELLQEKASSTNGLLTLVEVEDAELHPDGHHLTRRGHIQIVDALVREISRA